MYLKWPKHNTANSANGCKLPIWYRRVYPVQIRKFLPIFRVFLTPTNIFHFKDHPCMTQVHLKSLLVVTLYNDYYDYYYYLEIDTQVRIKNN